MLIDEYKKFKKECLDNCLKLMIEYLKKHTLEEFYKEYQGTLKYYYNESKED